MENSTLLPNKTVNKNESKNYGTISLDKSNSVREIISPQKKFTFDKDGVSATCAAYVGEMTSGAIAYTAPSFCVTFNAPTLVASAAVVGLITATCTFFGCRKLIEVVSDKNPKSDDLVKKPEVQLMKN